MTLAFHVLANTGFGTDYSFKDIDDIPSKKSYTMTWSKASNTVRENMLVAVTIPNCILSMPFAPQKWNQAGRAIVELKRYMADILDQERSHFFKGVPKSGKLLSSLMHASDEVKRGKEGQLERSKAATSGLSREEMLGDIYVFSLAGHETTGNALAFAIYLLSVHPEIQTWVQEEIDQVHRDNDTISDLEYESSPLLKRSLAVMVSHNCHLHSLPESLQSYGDWLTCWTVGDFTTLSFCHCCTEIHTEGAKALCGRPNTHNPSKNDGDTQCNRHSHTSQILGRRLSGMATFSLDRSQGGQFGRSREQFAERRG